MTYSNWSVSTPFQHGSEFDKTCDETSMNKINPLVVGVKELNMPGTWAAAYDFSHYRRPPLAAQKSDSSPICSLASSAGDRTTDMCSDTMPKCPLNRDLIPDRRIDTDLFGFSPFLRAAANKNENEIIIALIILIIVLVILKR